MSYYLGKRLETSRNTDLDPGYVVPYFRIHTEPFREEVTGACNETDVEVCIFKIPVHVAIIGPAVILIAREARAQLQSAVQIEVFTLMRSLFR